MLMPPATDAELQQIHGIGATKAERYGEGLLRIVRDWVPGGREQ
jgi:hypothetical protein